MLNLLVQPDRTQTWLRVPLISALALLPLRLRGVQDTIEFVFSIHPSSRLNVPTGNNKRSGISHDALNAASRLLSAPPGGMTPDNWFSGIAPQLLSLLHGEGEPEMDKAAAFIIGFGILGRKQYGAPGRLLVFICMTFTDYKGMPGWKAFVEPILQCIDPNMGPKTSVEEPSKDLIITFGAPNVLVSSERVAKGIRDLSTLLTSHPHPSLTKRLLRPVLLPLWAMASWYKGNETTESTICKPARWLLSTLVQLSPSSQDSKNGPVEISSSYIMSIILKNLTYKGGSIPDQYCWEYVASKDGGIQIQESSVVTQDILPDVEEIDVAVDGFIAFVATLGSTADFDVEISSLFISLCSKWFSENAPTKQRSKILTRVESASQDLDFRAKLVEAKVMQKMMAAFPDKLIVDSHQVLELASKVLSDTTEGSEDGNSSEDTVSVALSLLNIVFASPSFKGASEIKSMDAIEASLHAISRSGSQETSTTAKNLLLLLRFRSSTDEPEDPEVSKPTDQQLEDRKTYNLALSYLTGIDSPPPVRAQGLELISNLIRANSSTLDIPALLVLFSSLLQDTEEYIYLRAIQSIILLSHRHPKAVPKDLIDRYVDPTEVYELDQRLRLGEALLQVIQNSPLAFSGEGAKSACEGLLFVAGRRGYRPKTEQEQHKRNKLKRKQNQEAEEAWDGPVPQLDEVLEIESQDNEILAQLISGWESKRGSEDVRIRASAISILGSAIETNVAGIGSRLVSAAVDLSIHILTLEPEIEKGILRRAAILLVMHFVKALDVARAEGKKLGFGFVGQSLEDVQRILEYVGETDNDGLVQQHARDVIEGLQAWQINVLLPEKEGPAELQELAGLSINPGRGSESAGRMRPRIEEIE